MTATGLHGILNLVSSTAHQNPKGITMNTVVRIANVMASRGVDRREACRLIAKADLTLSLVVRNRQLADRARAYRAADRAEALGD